MVHMSYQNTDHRTHEPCGAWDPAIILWIIALTVTLATFMEVLDTSIANVALPHIAGGLGASADEATWVLTSYLVSNAIVLPLSGWISSIVGRKHFYMFCVSLFTASSFMCGLAPNLRLLIIFRILQGMGGGGLQPSEQAILADTFTPAKRGMASPFTAWPSSSPPPRGPPSAAGSPTTIVGAGFFTSTFPSAFSPSFSLPCSSPIRPGSK